MHVGRVTRYSENGQSSALHTKELANDNDG